MAVPGQRDVPPGAVARDETHGGLVETREDGPRVRADARDELAGHRIGIEHRRALDGPGAGGVDAYPPRASAGHGRWDRCAMVLAVGHDEHRLRLRVASLQELRGGIDRR